MVVAMWHSFVGYAWVTSFSTTDLVYARERSPARDGGSHRPAGHLLVLVLAAPNHRADAAVHDGGVGLYFHDGLGLLCT
jgi:hypothetical protein